MADQIIATLDMDHFIYQQQADGSWSMACRASDLDVLVKILTGAALHIADIERERAAKAAAELVQKVVETPPPGTVLH